MCEHSRRRDAARAVTSRNGIPESRMSQLPTNALRGQRCQCALRIGADQPDQPSMLPRAHVVPRPSIHVRNLNL